MLSERLCGGADTIHIMYLCNSFLYELKKKT